jgi:hypothetical protein
MSTIAPSPQLARSTRSRKRSVAGSTGRRVPPLELDFIQSGWRPGIVGWLTLALGLGFSAWVLVLYSKASAELAGEEARLAHLTLRADQRRIAFIARQRETVPEAELRRVGVVATSLGRPWADLFAALDATADAQIALTRFEPNASRGVVILGGEARSLPELFDYARALGAQRGIQAAHVDSYAFRDTGNAHSVEFSLSAQWGATP